MKHLKYYFFSYLAATLIIIASVIPIPDDPPLGDVDFIDKWVHFVMYGGFACAMWFDAYRSSDSKRIKTGTVVLSILIPVVTGGLMELVQEFLTTYRTGDFIDFCANTFGDFIGVLLGIFLVRPCARKLWKRG